MRGHRAAAALALGVCLVAAGCSKDPDELPAPVPSQPSVSVTPSPSASHSSTPQPKPVPKAPTLKGDTDNAIAFAPLSNPDDVTILGSVPSSRAWSTSKVLVIMAFLQEVAGGDPDNLTQDQRDLIKLALTESDLDALLALRAQIPGGSGAPETAILRSVGDNTTTAPDISEGSMQWSIRNQIKFLAALYEGKVVSKKASQYVLDHMHPVESESWGLGTIGATAFKGGWLTPDTETRQMGYVDGYAVAIITYGQGPAAVQIDGDSAHVEQMNKLARILKKNLEADQARAQSN